MNVVFIGASNFGNRCLQSLINLPEINIVGAVTAPARFSISYNRDGVNNVLHTDITTTCEPHHIPCQTIGDEGMKNEILFEKVMAWQPDIFLVAGWYHMIPKKWRDMVPAYGLHASLLPHYSGGAPLVWAIINGEKQTGITLFQFADGVDNGPIAGQKATPIYPEDTIATLYERIEELGISLLEEKLPQLASGSLALSTQDESKRRLYPQRAPEDGRIDWSQPAAKIYDFIRAQTKPYPGAFTLYQAKKLSIWSSIEADRPVDAALGSFIVENEEVFVSCGNGTSLKILSASINDQEIIPNHTHLLA